MEFTARLNENPTLKISDGGHTVTKKSDVICEQAQNVALSAEKCKAQLSKTGSTAYNVNEINIEVDDDVSIPISALNSLRRECTDELDDLRKITHNYKINEVDTLLSKLCTPKPFCRFCNINKRRYGIKWAVSQKKEDEWV